MIDDKNIDFRSLVEHSLDIICCFGLDRRIIYASPSSFTVLGYTPEEVVGKGSAFFVLPEDMAIIEAAVVRLLDPKVDMLTTTVRMRRKDGSIIWTETNARMVRDKATRQPYHLVIVIRDITGRFNLEEQLASLALTDGLTGISNRRAFDEALLREWKRTCRERTQISLLLLDLDNFKKFNDLYGHQAGDDCLRSFSIAVSAAVRDSDVVARYGGEEFAVILPGTGSVAAAYVAEKVVQAIEFLDIVHDGNPEGNGRLTASIGVATAVVRERAPLMDSESLLVAADSALYKAKKAGRNRVAASQVVVARSKPQSVAA